MQELPTTHAADAGQLRVLASDGKRIVAYLIDLAPVILLGLISREIGTVLGLIYMVVRDGLPFLDGQSIGKRVMNIRAVTLDGASLANNWGPAIIRNIVLLIPFFPLVELVVLLTNKDKQRLGDQFAKTMVIVSTPA
ncbi:MAG: RDD family protein [Bacteroidetes bacterium]|jgi:uncharacterized RDD family membrane protein YckC|nr:MAG: RDD family protein [Bacteroidota bacterium]